MLLCLASSALSIRVPLHFFCVFQPAPHTLSMMVHWHISVKVKELALSLSFQELCKFDTGKFLLVVI